MKRISLIAVPALMTGVLLSLNTAAHAQAATNIFTLAVDPNNTSNLSALQANDVVKLDVVLNSDNVTQLFSYNAAIAFNPNVFTVASSSYTNGTAFQSVPVSGPASNTNSAGAPYSQLYTATASNGGSTKTYGSNVVLGTYNLVVSNTAPQGVSNIFFSNQVPNGSGTVGAGAPSQAARKNLLATSAASSFTPTFSNNGIGVIVGAAPVPETSTLLGLAVLVAPAMWTLRRKRGASAA